MPPIPRTLLTLTICTAVGAMAGKLSQSRAVEKEVQAARAQDLSVPRAAALMPKQPAWSSVTAIMEWLRSERSQGNAGAAEQMFRLDAGLTLEQRAALAKALVNDFRHQEPWVLARIVMGLPRGSESDRLLWSLVATWSSEDAEEAVCFIETLPADRLNDVGVLQNAGFGLCKLPAERVLAFAAKLTDYGRACLATGLVGFADQAGSWRNSSAILARLDARPDKEAISAEWMMGRQLGEIDPQIMESQIAAEPNALKRDEMLVGYAWATGRNDPVRGIELGVQIQRPLERDRLIQSHVEDWLRSDRAAALNWLQSDDARRFISTGLRRKLLTTYRLEAAR